MKQLTCEVCGGNDLLKQDGVFVCQSCGCKYSAQEVKKLMVQISDPVKVEGINSVDQQLENVRQLILTGNIKAATDILNILVAQAPSHWEVWYEKARIIQINYFASNRLEVSTYTSGMTEYEYSIDSIEKYFQNALKCSSISIETVKEYFLKLKEAIEQEHHIRMKKHLLEGEAFFKSLFETPASCSFKDSEFAVTIYWNGDEYSANLHELRKEEYTEHEMFLYKIKQNNSEIRFYDYPHLKELCKFINDGFYNAKNLLNLYGNNRYTVKDLSNGHIKTKKISVNDEYYFTRDKIVKYLCGDSVLKEIKTKFNDRGCPKNYEANPCPWDIEFVNGYTVIFKRNGIGFGTYNDYVTYPTKIKVNDNIKNIYEQAQNIDVEKKYDKYRKSGCYIATSIYGSYDCPEVWTLRRYRDYTIAQTWYGRAFIKTYYAISPTLVKWFGNTIWFQNFWKNKLDKMVCNLKDKGYEDKPYID